MSKGLEQSGKQLADTIFACLQDPRFRDEMERIGAERLVAAEHKLVDLLLSRLDAAQESGEKVAVAIWQQLKDERRRSVQPLDGPKQAARPARHGARPERADAAKQASGRSEELTQLLDVIRKRLAAAEAKAATAEGGQGSSISSSRTRS